MVQNPPKKGLFLWGVQGFGVCLGPITRYWRKQGKVPWVAMYDYMTLGQKVRQYTINTEKLL